MEVEGFVPIFPTPTILLLFVVSIDYIFTIFGRNMNKLRCISRHVFGATAINVPTLLQGVYHSYNHIFILVPKFSWVLEC